MPSTALVKIAIDVVHDGLPESKPSANICHICEGSLEKSEVRTVLSCCHVIYHAGCLSEWFLMDRGSGAQLPMCTRCSAPLHAQPFHYAMALLATQAVQLRPKEETEKVHRLIVEVANTDMGDLGYNPMAQPRQGLRNDRPAERELFRDANRSEIA